MGSYKQHALYTAILSANLLTVVGFNPVFAAETSATDAPRLDTVIVTGTRAQERTASASLSPIDVISRDTPRSTGPDEPCAVLAWLILSINLPLTRLPAGPLLVRPALFCALALVRVFFLVIGWRLHSTPLAILVTAAGRC